ncbi:MAG: hypothetical protein M8352_09980, partial [ANME-2 cluster archaeon]|nr:hypothetical protein [ANME-2 cluster archaeon]
MKKRITDMGKGIVSGQSRYKSTRFSASSSVSKPTPTALDTGRSRNPPSDACRSMLRTGVLLAVAMLVMLALAGAGSAATTTVIKVATDRYIVLDDPINSGGSVGAGYGLPDVDWGTQNRWGGNNTTIGAIALYFNSTDGTPQSGETIDFTIYYPNGSTMPGGSGSIATDSNGLASFYTDLDDERYYGEWTVKAEINGTSQNTTFIYNWWGCSWSSGGCNNQHGGADPASQGTTSPNSPYTASWEQITIERPDHYTDISANGFADDYCTVCHLSYDDQPTNSTPGTKDFTPPGAHSNIRCDNASCHDPGASFSNHNAGTIVIGSCNDCHSRADITMKSTLNGIVSAYSNSSSGTYDKYHTPTSTVPCIICHGPMHNISKPDPTVGGLDSDTEDSHCTTCHQSYTQHNTTVACTECHTEDVHVIKFIQNDNSNATNRTNAATCPDCHVGSGLASFPTAPRITEMTHSDNILNGTLWDSGRASPFWTAADDESKCLYCHGDTKHSAEAAGYINSF